MTIETPEQWNESIRRGREIIAREVAKAIEAAAWYAYSKAWPEAMAGQSRAQRPRDAGYTPRPRITGAGGLPLVDECDDCECPAVEYVPNGPLEFGDES